jgi:hypothetical protein
LQAGEAAGNHVRIHFLRQWYALSDPSMEEALYDTAVMRRFADINSLERIPDETTIFNFRRLLETQGLGAKTLSAGERINPFGGAQRHLQTPFSTRSAAQVRRGRRSAHESSGAGHLLRPSPMAGHFALLRSAPIHAMVGIKARGPAPEYSARSTACNSWPILGARPSIDS